VQTVNFYRWRGYKATSIYEASERDFRVVVVEDAISGIYERGKEELRNIGITIAKAKEVREYLMQAMQH
jgi:hypothetical protein